MCSTLPETSMSSRLDKALQTSSKAFVPARDLSRPAAILFSDEPLVRLFQNEGWICTITNTGRLTVWAENLRTQRFHLRPNLTKVISGELLWSEGLYFVQSRKSGISVFTFDPDGAELEPPLLASFQPSLCFSRMKLLLDKKKEPLLLLPTTANNLGIVKAQLGKKKEATLDLTKDVKMEGDLTLVNGDEDLIIFGSESGMVGVLCRDSFQSWSSSSVNLNALVGKKEEEDAVIPTCSDFLPRSPQDPDRRVLLVGSSLRHCFKLSLDKELKKVEVAAFPLLANKGMSALQVREDGLVFSVAGWDGRIRLCSVEDMKVLQVIKCSENSVVDIAFWGRKDGRWGVVGAGAGETKATVWYP